MLVTPREFAIEVASLNTPVFAFDFETNGLNPRKDKAFIMGYAYPGRVACVSLTYPGIKPLLEELFSKKMKLLCHNAKFEQGFLKHQFGIEPAGDFWDTEVMAVLENNGHFKKQGGKGYGLQACAERMGMSKYPPMLEWLKKKANKNKYHEAPIELIVPYVEQDAYLSLKLFEEQRKTFISWDKNSSVPIGKVVKLEQHTTKNLFVMEQNGLLLDVAYCKEAIQYEQKRAEKARGEFKRLTGTDYVQSAKCLKPLFEHHGIPYGHTPVVVDKKTGLQRGGGPSFDYDSLLISKGNPIVDAILIMRDSDKRATTYWQNFLELQQDGIIYPNIRQAGTTTGRFSATDPNVQNWPDDSEDPDCKYPIRRAFIARPGSRIVSIDYSQMEYRVMADEAQDFIVIREILDRVDPHQKVADLAGVPRKIAKNVRFARQYGAGVDKICLMTKLPRHTVETVLAAMDKASPRCAEYSKELITWAKASKFSYNFLGRRYQFHDGYYKAPNYRIQGACSDVLRIAIQRISEYLRLNSLKTKMLIPIHDELVFDVPEDELYIVPKLAWFMKTAYTHAHLPLDVSCSMGLNFHDLEEIRYEEARNEIQGART